MMRQLLIASLMMGSTLTFIHPASAQTTNPSVNQLLQQTNEVIGDTNNYIRNVAEPEARRYQNYLQQLHSACTQYGHTPSCREYNIRMQRQLRHMDNVNRQYENWQRNRRY